MDDFERRGSRIKRWVTVVMSDSHHTLHLVPLKLTVRNPRDLDKPHEVLAGEAEAAARKLLEDPNARHWDYVGTLVAALGGAVDRGRINWAKEVAPIVTEAW
jgi:hypothetical protein